jgi:lipopolysaccharide transport system ATP-binding protein
MSDTVIKVEGLSKAYLVGHNIDKVERYTALRDVIVRNMRNMARKTRDMLQGRPIIQGDEVEEFWALNDVSFEIKQGETVGIIGRNGAGKSTLLKVLSRITEPTKGRITLHGRVASLLEVGTGFHPELTGRENIFLNGAILGMTRSEIRRKFEEIVAFAEIESFLDTPVKRYSSGMYVRLAFAVAAHLEPEILIVDEVLAVGDAQFQKKCLGKMDDVARAGRTVLFVSHQMTAVMALCQRAILLSNGSICFTGRTEDVVNEYLQNRETFHEDLTNAPRRGGEGNFRFLRYRVKQAAISNLAPGSPKAGMAVEVDLCAPSGPIDNLLVSIGVSSNSGEFLFSCPSVLSTHAIREDGGNQTITARLQFDNVPLAPGIYRLNFFCEHNGSTQDYLTDAGVLDIEYDGINGDEELASRLRRKGVLVNYRWLM